MRRREQRKSGGNLDQPSGPHHICLSINIASRNQFGAETQSPCQLGSGGFFRQERIRAGLDYKSVAPNRLERSTASRAAFEQVHFQRELARGSELAHPIRRREPGDPAADYRNPPDLWVGARLRLSVAQRACAATIDAIISINSGWSPTVGARSILIPASRATCAASISRSYSTST